MTGKKGGKGAGPHKTYKGPWPEDHSSIPGRKGEKGPAHEKTHAEGGGHAQTTKIPPPTAK